MKKEVLIIFVKNPILGTVKTRLAATVGDVEALDIYKQLLVHTMQITKSLSQDVFVYYNDHIDQEDLWGNEIYQKRIQSNGNLGQKMHQAFLECFDQGYDTVVVIGSDLMDIDQGLIEHAFNHLSQKDIIVGPALDGGYYLLGMRRLYIELFENKNWSTESVFLDTLSDINNLGLKYVSLPVLNDIDTEDDWKKHLANLGSQ
jgi:rSAM/selenodomain-associated transferase 1